MYQIMKSIIREFLTFSRSERRGIFTLVFLILLIQTLRFIYPYFLDKEYHLSEKEVRMFAIWALQEQEKEFDKTNSNTKFKSKKIIAENCFLFDPNVLDVNGWQKLGYSIRQAEAAVKYVSKGGRFYQKDDLKKLFFIEEDDYEILKPFIRLPEKADGIVRNHYGKNMLPVKRGNDKIIIELNKADSVELLKLKGIGPYRASGIIRYRKRLGGFYSPSQLLEIKGFPDSLFQKIANQIKTDGSLIKKININSIAKEELQKHPYGWYGIGNSIVNYRTKHGPFRNADDLRKILAIKPEMIERLLPYLNFE